MPLKVCVVKAMVFPVTMYGCENWTVKKAECWRTDAFKLWSWRRFLRIPWIGRRSNQSILKEINPKYLLKRLMLKLKLPILWPPDVKSWFWCWERLKARVEGDDRGWDGWMVSPSQWPWVWANSGRWWRTGKSGVLQSVELQRVGHDWVTEQQLQQRFYSTSKISQDDWFLLW